MSINPRYDKSNQRKSDFLGISQGTAGHRLKKMVMLSLISRLGEDMCYRCGKRIESADELSIDHKIDWLGVDVDLYWDIGNIAFSHRQCNSRAGISEKPRGKRVGPPGTAWCSGHQSYLPTSEFYNEKGRWNGYSNRCKKCAYAEQKARKARKKLGLS